MEERKVRDGRGKDAKWTAPHTTAQTLNEELAAKLVERLTAKLVNRLTAKLMNRLTAKLVDHLTAKLVDRLTAKLVVVNLVKLHLTKFNQLPHKWKVGAWDTQGLPLWPASS